MYCRNCGYEFNENLSTCHNCNTKLGEGVDYCNICGFETKERQTHCKNCGAKLTNIIPLYERKSRIKNLNLRAIKIRKRIKIIRLIGLMSLFIAISLFLFAVLRKAPEGIPELSTTTIVNTGFVEIITPQQKARTANGNVQAYWELNQKLLGYSIGLVVWFIYCMITIKLLRKQYKKIISKIMEEKECIAEHAEIK